MTFPIPIMPPTLAVSGLSVAYLTTMTNTTNLTTFTFTSASIGTAAADRFIVVDIFASGGSVASVSSVTVGGTGANAKVIANRSASNGQCEIWGANVSSGTTADVVVAFNNTANRAAISMYWATGLISTTAVSTAIQTTGSTASLSIDVSAGGVCFAAASNNNATSTVYTGVTEDADTVVETVLNVSAAHDVFASAQSPLTITITPSGGNAITAAAVSFV